ncbi:hypothetical protein RJD38_20435 [Vibrio scophthalmi]|uniref:Uncharacterized protein n=2 Tax=Vibrio scophthalmi TaxID=45658 RepID=A0A1B1NUU7_9VIBR|nr:MULTISPECIES: hypothetical protein [Vibrio]ANS87391.1 hypothetical protein VSVS12_03690 [Vibrio scophthalmi]ANU38571.1 hypothetical protein VSVS05_03534 [Vibrio scophthalmi]EGU31387.1 hypothetical protein VIS19158_22813 [Vibrio scophthalmi LMG 19158]EGU35548.1 hypothetical protein VIBRN418_11090 [Vibrio sp. N418]MCY9805851.1 hypothetical protein [Vibrio scophthalmi]
MSSQDTIRSIEQQIYVACSEGDYDTLNMLEHQLERLRSKAEHPFDDDPYAPEGKIFPDDEW